MALASSSAWAASLPQAVAGSQLQSVQSGASDVEEADEIEQVTSVSQLADVQPTDWAFQSLQSLVERYGCIVGYPDRTYKGNQSLTRYEFAAGLNACLDKINELIAASTADLVKKEDLAVLQKLQEEFAAELATLRGRVSALEVRTATLEKQQFSTTTKLVGEAIFAINNIFGQQIDELNNTVFDDRVRLDLQTSFTGKDLLHTRLTAGNVRLFQVRGATISAFVFDGDGQPLGTSEGSLASRVNSQTQNQIVLDRLDYSFPVGDRLSLYVAATGGKSQYYVPAQSTHFLKTLMVVMAPFQPLAKKARSTALVVVQVRHSTWR